MKGDQHSLFGGTPRDEESAPDAPLPERLRPKELDQLVGLDELLAPGAFLRNAIESDRIPSMIFWGPPGSGKTTLARIIARRTESRFIPLSAVTSGIKEVKQILEEARSLRRLRSTRTIVFIDEIHRFNRSQQDAFLPYVESGDIVLIGATTENPSFEVNSALLSRAKVIVLPRLEHEQIIEILHRAMKEPQIESRSLQLDGSALDFIASISGGDARQALNSLELVIETSRAGSLLKADDVRRTLQQRSLLYDKSGEEHYNIISALHKSVRDGDADAAVYWTVRMLEGGEDPLYVTRRLIRAAVEDIGLADPRALQLAVATKETVHFLGMPEAGIAIAQLAIYLSLAPKSNAVYAGYEAARREVREGSVPPVPLHIRNASTALMKEVGYGAGYRYVHDGDAETTGMSCLPEELIGRRFYEPKGRGLEGKLLERLEELRKLRKG
jgi:putative ATPase